MDYTILIRPLIGAVIGYVTNYIAVKMMFRPIHPVKIGKLTLPFTPGVIPKNKERIARSIGETVSTHLLTPEELRKNLLSIEKKQLLHDKIDGKLKNIPNELTIHEGIETILPQSEYDAVRNKLESVLTQKIVKALIEENTGAIIAEQIEKVANEKLNNPMFGMLGINSLVSGLSKEVATKINEYLSQNGNELIEKMLKKEFEKIENNSLQELLQQMSQSEIDIAKITVTVYEKVVEEELSEILEAINISQIITDKINAMDMLELEALLLKIMKKELNALINLGALIGFILGLLNLLL